MSGQMNEARKGESYFILKKQILIFLSRQKKIITT